MDQSSSDTLARSCLAQEQHRRVGRRHLCDAPPHTEQQLAFSKELDRFIVWRRINE
jgi:hypothetical protein